MRTNQISLERQSVRHLDGTMSHDVVLRIRCASLEQALALRENLAEQAVEGEITLPFSTARTAPIDGEATDAPTIEGPG